ncbi:MAG: LutB/LldF family L-lactate oxidation iron-sulfur protein [bacterium]
MSFPQRAASALADEQLRRNLGNATATITQRRAEAVAELPDWSQLRAAGAAIKDQTLNELDQELLRFEANAEAAGAKVHWARDGDEACRIVAELMHARKAKSAIKVKSLTTDEIGLNNALQEAGIEAVETDLAELIVQLGNDSQSHILVPAIHRNRSQIRELFVRSFAGPELTDDPADLAEAARLFLRKRFLEAGVGISGANFGIAETGSVCVVESEGNGRMCTTLPELLITVMGIEKLIPSWRDLEVFMQLLPRSATGERMSPYTTVWTGVHADDGPKEFHIVLLDNGRTDVLANEVGRQALRCIRCSACLNVCPVYSRTGGHAYGSIYPGPIGAILVPQLSRLETGRSLPFASTLCGACEDVCPVKIEIPRILVELRAEVVRYEREHGQQRAERGAMRGIKVVFAGRRRYEAGQRAGRIAGRLFSRRGKIDRAPGPLRAWTASRSMKPVAAETFRRWWRRRER